jgi:hypothetical protein
MRSRSDHGQRRRSNHGDDVTAFLHHELMKETKNYLERGRRFSKTLPDELAAQWVIAFRAWIKNALAQDRRALAADGPRAIRSRPPRATARGLGSRRRSFRILLWDIWKPALAAVMAVSAATEISINLITCASPCLKLITFEELYFAPIGPNKAISLKPRCDVVKDRDVSELVPPGLPSATGRERIWRSLLRLSAKLNVAPAAATSTSIRRQAARALARAPQPP